MVLRGLILITGVAFYFLTVLLTKKFMLVIKSLKIAKKLQKNRKKVNLHNLSGTNSKAGYSSIDWNP